MRKLDKVKQVIRSHAEMQMEHRLMNFKHRNGVFITYCKDCALEAWIDPETLKYGGNAIHAFCPER